MQLPQFNWLEAGPLGISSILSFLISFVSVRFLLVPKVHNVRKRRDILMQDLSNSLAEMSEKRKKLEMSIEKVDGTCNYGWLHKEWEKKFAVESQANFLALRRQQFERNQQIQNAGSDKSLPLTADLLFNTLAGLE